MRTDELTLRVPLTRLLAGLCLAVIPLSLLALYTVNRADHDLKGSIGDNLETIAVSSATRVSAYVHDRVIQVGALTRMPAVTDAVAAANRSYAGVTDAAFQDKVTRIEAVWNTPAANGMVKEMLGSPASRTLRAQLAADPRLLRITLTDVRGAVIAATHKTLDYYQADEDFWQAIQAQGRGSLNLTDILFDEVTRTNYIGIGVPVTDPETNQFVGALDVLMDLSSVFPAAAARYPGQSLQMQLVRSDGTVLIAPGVTLAAKVKSPAWAAVVESMPGTRGSGHLLAKVTDGQEELIAFADTGLAGDYKNLSWVVVVTQNAAQSLAPIRGIVRLFFLYVAAGLAAIVLLAAYFTLHRKVHYEDIASAMANRTPA